MRICVLWLAFWPVFGAMAAQEASSKVNQELSSMQPPPYLPEPFEARVAAQGGRTDFVFGDERPFNSCHASTLAQTPDGALLCAWFGGTQEGKEDVAIWMARFGEGGWASPWRVAKVDDTAHWNPVLFRDPERGLFLFFKVGMSIAKWKTHWMRSSDNGKTWSVPAELVPGDEGGRGPVKNKPIRLADGAWLAPASTENGGWKPFADRSEDGGATWARTANWAIDRGRISGSGAIQPALWESAPGSVHALMRTAAGCIARADSADGGRTWSEVYRTSLPNNNSGIDVLRLEDARLLLLYNPVAKSWGPRTPLNLAISADNGATWTDLASLEDEFVDEEKSEFSYPAIIRTREGIAISYTWKRERIRCWQVPLSALDRP